MVPLPGLLEGGTLAPINRERGNTLQWSPRATSSSRGCESWATTQPMRLMRGKVMSGWRAYPNCLIWVSWVAEDFQTSLYLHDTQSATLSTENIPFWTKVIFGIFWPWTTGPWSCLIQGHMISTIIILSPSKVCYIKKERTQYLPVYLSCGRKCQKLYFHDLDLENVSIDPKINRFRLWPIPYYAWYQLPAP